MEDFINMIIDLVDRVDFKELILGGAMGWFAIFLYFRLSMRDFFARRELSILTYLVLENADFIRHLHDENGNLTGVEIRLDGKDLKSLSKEEHHKIKRL